VGISLYQNRHVAWFSPQQLGNRAQAITNDIQWLPAAGRQHIPANDETSKDFTGNVFFHYYSSTLSAQSLEGGCHGCCVV
jgi:hypothetical protein